MTDLIHDLIFTAAEQSPNVPALTYQDQSISYAILASEIEIKAGGLLSLGLGRRERVAVYLEKRIEAVIALFAASAAGGVFVPVNPVLKSEQVTYILINCNVRILVTSLDRLKVLQAGLPFCHDLHTIVVVDAKDNLPVIAGFLIISWQAFRAKGKMKRAFTAIDSDMAAIVYTSGSTGKSKGVVLSHRNLMTGTRSVTQYLQNRANDRILTVLPLSFDYGLNQLTTAFKVGAENVLMNYLLPRDIVTIIKDKKITGLAAVPPLWIQLAQLDWSGISSLRYITSSGGTMPHMTLKLLRKALPETKIFLMYGFTEAFRSTYLAPEEIERRPGSIGKAIPNAEILVLREDGSHCVPGEPGELVHRGSLVSMGYWNDAERTALCFKPIKVQNELPLVELAAWSGDTVRIDEEGFLYFIERRDEMIKTSGYRVSPTEIEEVIYASDSVAEAVALGVPHPWLGEAVVVIIAARMDTNVNVDVLLAECKHRLPAYMQPQLIDVREGNLPRNQNGKIDRKLLAHEMRDLFMEKANSSE
ncbi:MAG: acyl-CoA ligase (AMP-forming), exosortase A system-associated [Nitrosomonas sp.]|nr:MAG: acyl-CoA ligase (AMP-forming), exosortase A system-associated [Nitrosomonas sp.]